MKTARPAQLPASLLHLHLRPNMYKSALNSPPKPAPPVISISINGISIIPVTQAKNLGVFPTAFPTHSGLQVRPHHLTHQQILLAPLEICPESSHFHHLHHCYQISPRLSPETSNISLFQPWCPFSFCSLKKILFPKKQFVL